MRIQRRRFLFHKIRVLYWIIEGIWLKNSKIQIMKKVSKSLIERIKLEWFPKEEKKKNSIFTHKKNWEKIPRKPFSSNWLNFFSRRNFHEKISTESEWKCIFQSQQKLWVRIFAAKCSFLKDVLFFLERLKNAGYFSKVYFKFSQFWMWWI